jgi:hypothetical protein
MRFAGGEPALAAAPARDASSAANELTKFVPPPAQRFAEIADRPLFLPERRPQLDAEPQVQAPAPMVPTLAVQGVVLTDNRRYAVIQHGNPPKLESISEGMTVDGWKVESIAWNKIALRSGAATVEIAVGKTAQQNAAPPPVTQRARRGWGGAEE